MKSSIPMAILALLLVVTAVSCKKEDVNSQTDFPTVFFENDYAAAKAEAENLNRKIFVDFYAVWCTICADFKENTLNDQAVVDYIKDNYVAVALDGEKEGESMYNNLDASGFPVLAIYDTQGNLVAKHQGKMNPQAFVDWLEENK